MPNSRKYNQINASGIQNTKFILKIWPCSALRSLGSEFFTFAQGLSVRDTTNFLLGYNPEKFHKCYLSLAWVIYKILFQTKNKIIDEK